MAKDPKQMTGYLYVLAAAVLWSLIGPFSKICMEEGLAPLEVAFWRALLGGICFFAQTGICGGARIPVKHALFFCLFGVLSISVFFSSLQISIQLSGAAMAMVLLYTAPAWVAVFSRILFHESFSSRKGIALGLAQDIVDTTKPVQRSNIRSVSDCPIRHSIFPICKSRNLPTTNI